MSQGREGRLPSRCDMGAAPSALLSVELGSALAPCGVKLVHERMEACVVARLMQMA